MKGHEDDVYATGTVKFFRAEKGWGGLVSDEVDADVWVHFSAIERESWPGGWSELKAGDQVEFRYHPAQQDSWRYVASWVKRRPVPGSGA